MRKICEAFFFNLNHSKPFETDFRLIKNRRKSIHLQGGYREGWAYIGQSSYDLLTTILKYSGYFLTYLHDLDVWVSV